MKPEIRQLTADELTLAVEMGPRFFTEAKLPGTFRPEAFLAFWRSFYGQGCGRMYGAFVGGTLVGVVGGLVTPDICTGELRCTELFWWLEPGHRSGRTALDLFAALEGWAAECECEAITFMFVHGVGNGTTLDKWYRRHGYEPLEVHYVRRLRC